MVSFLSRGINLEILSLTGFKALLIGFFVGTVIGLTGIGAILAMPCLIYVLGIPPVPAVGTGLLFGLLTRIRGAIEHHRLKNIHIKASVLFAIGAAPSTIISSRLVNYFSESGKFAGLDSFLQYTMGSILIVTLILLLIQNASTWKSNSGQESIPPGAGLRGLSRGKKAVGFTRGRKIGCILAGALIGTLIGATSIGGGVLVIPVLMIFFGLNPSIAVGTSILISVVCTMVGGTVYLLSRNINLPVLLPMLLGSWPGVVIGSRLTRRIPQRVLKIFLMIAIAGGTVTFFWGARR